MSSRLTHVDEQGAARMVDVGDKEQSVRRAVARGRVSMSAMALEEVERGSRKGDVLQVARIAGIQGAKKTPDLVPLCHPLLLDSVEVHLALDREGGAVLIEASVRNTGRTGVEMEALTAVAIAALTVYDMVKSVDRGMRIEGIELVTKEGGRSGTWTRRAGEGGGA